jgi:hypothetical protein
MSKMDLGLQRDGCVCSEEAYFVDRLGKKWGCAFARYAALIGRGDGCWWLRQLADWIRADDEEQLIGALKAVSREATEFTVLTGFGGYSYLMDVHVLGGYDTVLNRKDVMVDIERDVGRVPPPLEDDDLSQRVMVKVRAIVSANWALREQLPTFEDFVSFRDAWSTPGASTLPGKAVLRASDGYEIKVKGKFASALEYSDSELVRLALEHKGAIVRPFRKIDEPVKTRVVYGYDFLSFLRCSWIDSLVGDMEAGGSWLPVGYSRRQKADMRLEIMRRLRVGNEWAVSLDQSAFDQHQRKEWVRAALAAIFDVVAELAPTELKESIRAVQEAELFSFDHAAIPGVCAWEIGVPSGLRWTAVVDSILNRAECEVVCENLGFVPSLSFFQGDDAVVVGRGCHDPEAWAAEYGRLGLEVNRDKTWVSRYSCDFLHELYSGVEVRAFPARIARSLIWKKPRMGGRVDNPVTRLQERMADALKGYRRDLFGAKDYAYRQLRAAAKQRRCGGLEHIEECLETPTFLGGWGFGIGGRFATRWTGGEVDFRRYEVTSAVPGVPAALRGALVGRMAESCFLRTRTLKMELERVVGPSRTARYSGFGHSNALKTDFVVYDHVKWIEQLRLELAVAGVRRWRDVVLIPDARLRTMRVRSALKVLRAYASAVNFVSLLIDTAFTTAESYLEVAEWSHSNWQGACVWWALHGRSRGTSWLGEHARAIGKYILHSVLFDDPAFLVRV